MGWEQGSGVRKAKRTRETRLLRIMSLQRQPLARVRNIIRRDGRVMGYLLDDEVRLSSAVRVWPVAVEEPMGDGDGRAEGRVSS